MIELPSKIDTSDDLVVYIENLRADLKQNPDQYENITLDSYLEAMTAWISDYSHVSEVIPSWELIAHILTAAAIYE